MLLVPFLLSCRWLFQFRGGRSLDVHVLMLIFNSASGTRSGSNYLSANTCLTLNPLLRYNDIATFTDAILFGIVKLGSHPAVIILIFLEVVMKKGSLSIYILSAHKVTSLCACNVLCGTLMVWIYSP